MNSKKAVSAGEMREIDRIATEKYGIPGIILMENAGRCAAEAAAGFYQSRGLSGVIGIFCGAGNNGGDGFVAARHLADKGFSVEIVMARQPGTLKGDALLNYTIVKNLKLPLVPLPETIVPGRYALIIDALLGTGLSGEVTGVYRKAIDLVNAARTPVIAVDIPSGLDADSGKPLGTVVKAAETVTMGLPKKGFLNPDALQFLGKITVADISLPHELLRDAGNEQG